MSASPKRENIWKLLPPSSSFEKYFRVHPEDTKYIPEFQTDVTRNPFRHPVRKRITRIEKERGRYPEGAHRWRRSDLRIVYLPKKENHTVYPMEAAKATNVGYKRRS